MIPRFLRPEVVPYASVEILPAPVDVVERTIEEVERARFRAFLQHPNTGPRLDALLAENAAVDAAVARPAVCAWCPDFDPTQSIGQSHGICAACAARLLV